MKKIIIFFFITFIFFSQNSYSADSEPFDGEGGREDLSFMNVKNSNFKKGIDALNQAIKFEQKNKLKKANKRYNDAINYFLLAREDTSDNVELLNYLGFSFEKVEDFFMSEIYYKEGLEIDPKNNQINRRLGELFFNTNRIDLAKKRLELLEKCNCDEYLVLKNIIEK